MTNPPPPTAAYVFKASAPVEALDAAGLDQHLRNCGTTGARATSIADTFNVRLDVAEAALAAYPKTTLYCGWEVYLHPEAWERTRAVRGSGVNKRHMVIWDVDLRSYPQHSIEFQNWWSASLQGLQVTLMSIKHTAPSYLFGVRVKFVEGTILFTTRYLAELDRLKDVPLPIGSWKLIDVPNHVSIVDDDFFNDGIPF